MVHALRQLKIYWRKQHVKLLCNLVLETCWDTGTLRDFPRVTKLVCVRDGIWM